MHKPTGDVLRIEAKRQEETLSAQRLSRLVCVFVSCTVVWVLFAFKGIAQWDEQREEFPGGLVVSGIRILGEAEEIKDQNGTVVFIDAIVEERQATYCSQPRL